MIINSADLLFFQEMNDRKPVKQPEKLISKYIENKRILPSNTPFPGLWNNDRTPYLIEPMNNMSPFSPVIHTIVMKGAQQGYTAAAENVLSYWMDEFPAAIMFMSATEDLLSEWVDLRLEPLIDSCGFRYKIKADMTNGKSKKSGDTSKMKTYPGGFLTMTSAQSPGKQRSKSIRILIRDEIDGAPKNLTTGEGNWLGVSQARTDAFADRKKIFDFSTPTKLETSSIYQQYLLGDQRKYGVTCPRCGKSIFLEFGENEKYGIKPIEKNNKLVDVVYICQECSGKIYHYEKKKILKNGKWMPTAKSSDDAIRSYHMNSLYSPVGMLSWIEVWKKYQKAIKNPDDEESGMRSFTNTVLGLPFQEKGQRIKIEKVNELRGGYDIQTVPEGVLYLTAAIDVQRGSEKYEEMTSSELQIEIDKAREAKRLEPFPRLEVEVLGHGSGYRSWSIDYKRICGKIDDVENGAWKLLTKYYFETLMSNSRMPDELKEPVFIRKDGREFPIKVTFVDAHDGEMTDIVYAYTRKVSTFYPIMGFHDLRQRKKEKRDERTSDNAKRYRVNKIANDLYVISISTNFYKTRMFRSFSKVRSNINSNPPGFMDHPRQYGDYYFKMLAAEEKRKDGSFYAGNRRAEASDCKVYNFCAGDFYLDSVVKEIRDIEIKKGMNRLTVESEITHAYVLSEMEKNTKLEIDKLIN